MSRNYSIGLSLLDIIGCALGGSVVLAVIFSVIRIPPPPRAPDEFILVQVQGVWQEGEAKGENLDDYGLIGFYVRAPNGKAVVIPPIDMSVGEARKFLVSEIGVATDVQLVSGWAPDLEAHTTYLSISQPSIGEWQITPYYFDFPKWLIGPSMAERPATFQGLKIEYWTAHVAPDPDANEPELPASEMTHPGYDSPAGFQSRTISINITST